MPTRRSCRPPLKESPSRSGGSRTGSQPISDEIARRIERKVLTRRVVTEIVNGRSGVALDGSATPSAHWDEVYTSPDRPLGPASSQPIAELSPRPGVVAWRVFVVPPDSVTRSRSDLDVASSDEALVDSDGFHQTATVDYIYLLEGQLSLRLDDDEVALHAGDCVVQRATNHTWHNYTDEPARVMGVMIGVVETFS
jgi:mannose-6-phosphate isomerase-like protein (cupin superfamily)